jgi:hypothetical protein
MQTAEDSTVPDEPSSDRPLARVSDPQVTDTQMAEPAVEEPTIAERTLAMPALEESPLEEATVALPTLAEPPVEEPTRALSTVEEPAAEEPTLEEPTQAELTAEEPTGGEPAVAETTAAELIVEDSVAADSMETDPLRKEIAATYAPVVALHQLCENRLRETETAGPGSPIGWTPYLKALRALRDGDVTGRWEDLARLMADPESLVLGADQHEADRLATVEAAVDAARALLIQAPASPERSAVIGDLVRRLAAAGERILVMAPSAAAIDALVDGIGDDAGILTVRAEPLEGPAAGTGPPEGLSHGATIRTVGTAYQQMWKVELRGLRRDLMWLEQWPRDRAAITAALADQEQRRRTLSDGEERLSGEIGERRAELEAAERAAAAALETRDRLSGEHGPAAESAAESRARYDGLQEAADAAAKIAAEFSQAAEESQVRCSALEERLLVCRQKLQAARDRETSLIAELDRARGSLPQASAEAERLYSVAADAAAEAHMSYYRMTAAESALTAERKALSWGQRIRATPERQELQQHRRQVSAYRRETDDAGGRAGQAREAFERAEAHRAEMAAFIFSGAQELAETRAAQEHFSADIERVSAEWDTARSEHPGHARRAAEAAEQAAQAAAAAGHAGELSRQAEERLAGLRFAHEQASVTADSTQAETQAALRLLTEAEAALGQLRAQAEVDLAEGFAEITAAEDTEAASRRHVQDMCGDDPALPDDALAGHRDRTMARVEELSAFTELTQEPLLTGDGGSHDALAEALLEAAGLVCGTPLGLTTGPVPHTAGFDTLIVDDADQITDSEFLVGAVLARRWILLGEKTGRPPQAYEEYEDHVHALAALHLAEQSTGTETDLDGAITTVAKRWGGHEWLRIERLPEVRSEAERIRDRGLWEDRYRDSYAHALRRLHMTGGADPEQDLITALTDRLGRSIFERCSAAAPGLCLNLLPDQGETGEE